MENTVRGAWGIHKAGAARYYWIVAPLRALCDADADVREGFATSREAAEQAVRSVVTEAWPTGHAFKYLAGVAASRHSDFHARKTRFRRPSVLVLYKHGAAWPGDDRPAEDIVTPVAVKGEGRDHYFIDDRRAWWRSENALAPDRHARGGYARVRKADVDAQGGPYTREPGDLTGFAWSMGSWRRPRGGDSQGWIAASEDRGEVAAELTRLRKVMQRSHPDKGGDPAAFAAAKLLFDTLRGRSRGRASR
jgi:hypothetical protein